MPALFGKLPSEADFVRHAMAGEAALEFERWVERGIIDVHARHAEGWHAPFDAAAPFAFATRALHGQVLLGVLAASRDAVGRRYPLVVLESVPNDLLRREPHLVPLVSGEFFDAACEIALHARGHDRTSLVRAASMLAAPSLGMLHSAQHEYEAWAESTPIAQAFATLFAPAPLAFAAHALDMLAQCVAPFRGSEDPKTSLGVRLPLGHGGAGAVAFWLDVVRRVAGRRGALPSHFWASSGEHGVLLVQFGQTPPGSLSELWLPDAESDVICDLTRAPGASSAASLARLPPRVAALLAAPSARVAQLLHVLE